ncbi:hypothetical protein MCOR25_000133 [Pyricularia grisea]|uniref:Aminoglycoside phosphotransferase domain-containing protein n=1 Tax=Pyricularia grisea TaxID=148305 RepID=A0A6P8BLT5_PYRGI|nr:uncharacterized protein PgNI_02384 [Pyricularia grisea]KAI6383212.1 hypothetical protein MCOR25_000133 [Pyricularia grisea]TLD17778.1 hypothetical protein PgNI_02384 [Pyricularia grisea]
MVPRFFSCSKPGCAKPSVRGVGGCDFCNLQFCGIHRSLPSHKCGDVLDDATYVAHIVAEIDRLRSRINDEAVCALATSLNGGKSCSIEHSSRVGPDALMGSANYHARIRFHDGSPNWLMRVPRVTSCAVGLPESLAGYLIRSEYATLKFLETTAVPAPRAFGFGVHGVGTHHGVGLSFLLMEELPGKSWQGDGIDGKLASQEDKARVLGGLADILIELAAHPFPKAGSLTLQGSDIQVSAVASDRFVVLSPEGPFDTSSSYYTAFAEQYLALIADGQLYTEYPVDAYLAYRFLKDNAAQLAEEKNDLHQAEEKFYLKHVDDKGDHLLVDDDFNITGIIDWGMARVVPFNEAFSPSLVTADMSSLCNGGGSLSDYDVALARVMKERCYSRLVGCMGDDKVRRFFWGLALEPKWSYALPLANAILRVFGVVQEWTEWKEGALKEYMSDERLQGLLARAGSAVP